MAKSKNFRNWVEEDSESYIKEKKKDTKRYDSKKSAIQEARRRKNKQRQGYM